MTAAAHDLLEHPAPAPVAPPLAEPTVNDVLAGRVACRVCGAFPAPFGFEVSIWRDRAGRWFCAAHRDAGVRGAP